MYVRLRNGWKSPCPQHRLDHFKRQELNELFRLNRRAMKAYLLNEDHDPLWSYTYVGVMVRYWNSWIRQLRYKNLHYRLLKAQRMPLPRPSSSLFRKPHEIGRLSDSRSKPDLDKRKAVGSSGNHRRSVMIHQGILTDETKARMTASLKRMKGCLCAMEAPSSSVAPSTTMNLGRGD